MTWLEGRLRVGMRYVYNSQRKQNFHGMFPKQIFKPEMYVYCEAVFLIVSTLIFFSFSLSPCHYPKFPTSNGYRGERRDTEIHQKTY